MELGLSLGDASKSLGCLKYSSLPDPTKKRGLDFCMSLGLRSPESGGAQKSRENDEGDDGDDADDDNQEETETEPENEAPLQLNFLPLASVPRRISSHLWSSDNGSSENGSSGNVGLPAAKGLDVNRTPAAEEVSSANSVGSPFHMEFSPYRNPGLNGNAPLGGNKRDFEASAAAADAAEAERASWRASDDDENGLNTRKKLRLSKEQSAFLEESFKEHNTLSPKQKLSLAKQLNLRPRQVEVWFQNRRARTKLKQTEVDCEYLKRCCDTLTDENRRLHKELQELRALKSSNPFHMQLPATTLTMCPSCERVATAAAPPTVTPAMTAAVEPPSISKAIPFPLTRPRYYPFSHPNQPAAS